MEARFALDSDREQLFAFVNTVSEKDSREIGYFFNEQFNTEQVIIYIEDNLIKGFMYFTERVLNVLGEKIKVAHIEEVLVDKNYSNEIIFNKCFEQIAYKYLLSSTNLNMLFDYGFTQVINKLNYTINRNQIFNVNGYLISDEFALEDVDKVYSKFKNEFNIHWDQVNNDISVEKIVEDYEIFVCKDSLEQIKGFIVYNYIDGIMHVNSLIYTDALSMLTLLNQAMGMNDKIVVAMSLYENIQLVINNLNSEPISDLGLKINDLHLFRTLFNGRYTDLNDLFESGGNTYYLV